MGVEPTTDDIRFATNKDMEEIECWLRSQKSMKNPPESLYVNWKSTKKHHRDGGKIITYIDNKTNKPVAYMCSNFDILEVQHSQKGKGVGRKMVERALQHASDKKIGAIKIICAPETSIPFWEKMGFTLYKDRNYPSPTAYKILNKKLQLPKPIALKITFYNRHTDKILETFSQKAVKTHENIVYLNERIVLFKGNYWHKIDIEVTIDGEKILRDNVNSVDDIIGLTNDSTHCTLDMLFLESYFY